MRDNGTYSLRERAISAMHAMRSFQESFDVRNDALAVYQAQDDPSADSEMHLTFASGVCDNLATDAAWAFDLMEMSAGRREVADAGDWTERMDEDVACLLDGKFEPYLKEIRACLEIGREEMRLPDVPLQGCLEMDDAEVSL